VDGTTHLQTLTNHGDGSGAAALGDSADPDRLHIRGCVVTRLINQEVCREKRTNRDLKPPIRVLRIGRCGGGCTSATEDDVSKITLSHVFVKTVVDPLSILSRRSVPAHWRAGDKGPLAVRGQAVKAVSRAERGRSNAKRLDRSTANLTIQMAPARSLPL
jgi:hypothetical protein